MQSLTMNKLVCYLLAGYLTSPILRLRKATQKLATGDLSARAGETGLFKDELSHLVRDFDTMAEQIEKLVSAQSRLLKDISHELRSPLARLNVALELARQRTGQEAEPQPELVAMIVREFDGLCFRIQHHSCPGAARHPRSRGIL